MKSIWNEKVRIPDIEKSLDKNIERDIVVIGGGIAGVLTAFRLAKTGHKVTLVEANTLYSGVTQNTTAHIDSLQGFLYSSLIKTSLEKAQLYYESQKDAISEYEKIVKEFEIECDFRKLNSYMFSVENVSKLIHEYNTLKKIGSDAEYMDIKSLLNFEIEGTIKLPNQAIFNPIDFLEGIPKIFEIIENTRIMKIDVGNMLLHTKKAVIKAEKIVVATGFPIIDIPGWYFIKMFKSQSYAMALEKVENIGAIYQSDIDSGLTYRNYKDKLIIGGLDHRSGRVNHENKFHRLRVKAEYSFSTKIRQTHRWNANDCSTFDSIPIVGEVIKNRKDLFVITGFNKWGMANAMIASMVICDAINGVANRYAKLLSPFRKKTEIGDFISNSFSTVKNLAIKPLMLTTKTEMDLTPGSGDIVMYNGVKKAVYKDKEGILYVSEPLCKHLKCQLQFNANACTWDCPCHGSRYDIYGKIIVSPTVENLENEVIE